MIWSRRICRSWNRSRIWSRSRSRSWNMSKSRRRFGSWSRIIFSTGAAVGVGKMNNRIVTRLWEKEVGFRVG